MKELNLRGPKFDVNKCICLVPPFSEQDVDKYFTLSVWHIAKCFVGQRKLATTLSYQEFGRNKEIMFDRWCWSTCVADFVSLRNLILLEEFKNSLPDRTAT